MASLTIPRVATGMLLRRASLAYLIIWVLSPPLAYGNGWRALAALSMLLWIAVDTLSSRSVLRKPSWPVLACVVFVFYTLFIRWLTPDGTTINSQFQLWIMFFFLLVGESFRRGREGDARFCFWLILCVLPVWCFRTLWGLEELGGDVARTVTRSSDEARELLDQGVGGYALVYTAVLCLPFLAHLALRSPGAGKGTPTRWKRLAARWLIWGNFILVVLLVLRAGYSIALILSTFAIFSVILVGARSLLPMAMSIFAVALLAFLASVAYAPALKYLEGAVAGTEYASKFRDIRRSAEVGVSTGTVSMRTERYLRSLKLFIESPVAGTLTFYDVGKHSAVLDRFAQYGFLIGALFLTLLIHVPIRALLSREIPGGLAIGFLVAAAGFPFLNNIFMSWGLVLFIFSRGTFVMLGAGLEKGRHQTVMHLNSAHA